MRPLATRAMLLCSALLLLAGKASAMGLGLTPARAHCGAAAPEQPTPPPQARHALAHSVVVAGTRNLAWAWLGSPTARYPHQALGSAQHAGSLHVLARASDGSLNEFVHQLPVHRVFEDRVPRLADLDGDGRDEVIVVQADALKGAALVVLGLRDGALVELARGPHAGSTFRWLNPVGVADFDGDGRLDVASVTTPHIGGVLTLHHYRPPDLLPYARAMDASNHRMGALEQQLAAIVTLPGQRPAIIVPDMQHTALHALRWEGSGKWLELNKPLPLPMRAQQLAPLPDGGCLLLVDGSWWQVSLQP